MQWQLPQHHGGGTVELATDGIGDGEKIIGWADEYGTITDNEGHVIGDLIHVEGSELTALVMKSV